MHYLDLKHYTVSSIFKSLYFPELVFKQYKNTTLFIKKEKKKIMSSFNKLEHVQARSHLEPLKIGYQEHVHLYNCSLKAVIHILYKGNYYDNITHYAVVY